MPRHEVHLIGARKTTCWENFRTFALCHTANQFREAVKLHKDADIFHVHNEPNWLVAVVREATDKPIVFDVHDSMLYRSDKPEHRSAAERLAFELSDAYVYVSGECRDISEKNNVSTHGKPFCVLPSYVNKRFYKHADHKWVGGLVYQGLITTDKNMFTMQYANYQKFAAKCVELNLPFHLYSCNIDEYKEKYYKDAIIEGQLEYSDLIKSMGHHDWGVVGNVDSYKDWDVALPNKLFEYLAGGIPVAVINARQAGYFVRRYKVGIEVKSLEELKKRWNERAKCQSNVMKFRRQFCMENHIGKLEEMYKCLLQRS